MIDKPAMYAAAYAEAFKERGVAEAYRYRPPYPTETFTTLAALSSGRPRHFLDVGCGTGDLARPLAAAADRIDAVDFSEAMLACGKRLPGGDRPNLRWIAGRIEDVALAPPYALIVAGESFHWFDWASVMPRLRALLADGGVLALVDRTPMPDPWSTLGPLIDRYRTDGGYQPYTMIAELVRHGLFRLLDERRTTPTPFAQPLTDYIESYHSRSGFSRERMGAARGAAFDREAYELPEPGLSDRHDNAPGGEHDRVGYPARVMRRATSTVRAAPKRYPLEQVRRPPRVRRRMRDEKRGRRSPPPPDLAIAGPAPPRWPSAAPLQGGREDRLVPPAAVSTAVAGAGGLAARREAIGAVHRLVAARLEGDLGLLATLAAHRREHLALRAIVAAIRAVTATRAAAGVAAAAATLLRLARAAAVRAATRLVGQPALLVELLLTGGEDEILVTIDASDILVLEAHPCT